MKKYWSNYYVWTIVAVVLCFVAFKLFYIDDDVELESYDHPSYTFNTTSNYLFSTLTKYESAPVVPEVPGLPGEKGEGVTLPDDVKRLSDYRFHEHAFNIIISDMISENRSLTDIRNPECKNIKYPVKLPTTSIIIVFHNEAWSTLIRTIWSVINRTPKELIKEIILVDDASDKDYLGEKLDKYVKTLPVRCIVLRQMQRLGLIQARLLGSANAKGQVLTFLDAHCECMDQWLEPLLTRIAYNRLIIPAPTIDVISDETFRYALASPGDWGGFNWKFNFKWVKVPPRERKRTNNSATAPLRPPTMAGGLFAIDREFFYELGSYDEGMLIWGAENLELSFRAWMCGGILEMVPCSHVGHVFRRFTPYTFPGGATSTVNYNTDRLVNVWADEYATFFYRANTGRSDARRNDVSDRLALRKRLQCKSFKWYLDNKFPEYRFPLDNYFYMGEISNVDTRTCLENSPSEFKLDKSYIPFTMYTCHKLGGNQMFVYTNDYEIIGDGICLDAENPVGRVNATICTGNTARQKWFYDINDRTIVHVNTGSCMTKPTANKAVSLAPCDGSWGQQWIMRGIKYNDEF